MQDLPFAVFFRKFLKVILRNSDWNGKRNVIYGRPSFAILNIGIVKRYKIQI